MSLRLVSSTGQMPVDIDDLKMHVKELDNFEDPLIGQYARAAAAHFDGPDGLLGRCLITKRWEKGYAGWSRELPLPFPDVSNVAVSYTDPNGDVQSVEANLFDAIDDETGPSVRFRSSFDAPTLHDEVPFPVKVEFDAGYGPAATDVPEPLRQAIRLLAAHFFANREATVMGSSSSPLPLGVEMLSNPYRRVVI